MRIDFLIRMGNICHNKKWLYKIGLFLSSVEDFSLLHEQFREAKTNLGGVLLSRRNALCDFHTQVCLLICTKYQKMCSFSFAEWFHTSAHCMQEEQDKSDGTSSEAWCINSSCDWGEKWSFHFCLCFFPKKFIASVLINIWVFLMIMCHSNQQWFSVR